MEQTCEGVKRERSGRHFPLCYTLAEGDKWIEQGISLEIDRFLTLMVFLPGLLTLQALAGLFPLDEELGLLPGNLTPKQQENLVHFGEVRSASQSKDQSEVEVTALSSFSRMTSAATFLDLVSREIQLRAVGEAHSVCAVTNGAEWLQGSVDLHRPDAVRILDFPHAAEHLSALKEALQQAGVVLPANVLDRCLSVLKHRGPTWLFRALARLPASLREKEAVREQLAYLSKRQALMQYQRYQQQGWPIGSGMVESANKVVVQARLKGAGMHWAPTHVNPLLALRTSMCNDRWSQSWREGEQHFFSQRTLLSQQRSLSRLWSLASALAWIALRLRPTPPPPPPPDIPRLPPSPPASVAGRPTASHPWKRAVVTGLKGAAKK